MPSTFQRVGAQGGVEASLDWWTAFGEAGLDRTVAATLASSVELRAAWARFEAASASVRVTRGGRRPAIDATASAGYGPSAFERDGWRAEVGIAASYEVDLWGRIAAAVRADEALASVARADWEAGAISLAGETTVVWLTMAAIADQQALLREQLANHERVLSLLERRLTSGLGQSADVLRQRAAMEATRQELTALALEWEVGTAALHALIGAPVSPADLPTGLPALEAVPPVPALGVPGDVLEQRPDVRAAFAMLEASEQELAVAAAARRPRLTLSAGLESGTGSAERIFRDWALSVAGGVLAPLFRGGALRAEQDRAEAERDARWFAYGQALMDAWFEVEESLAREAGARQRLEHLRAQLALYEQSEEVLERRYRGGDADFLDVLSARAEVQRLQRAQVEAQRDVLLQRVALYRAVAGGLPEDVAPEGEPPAPPSSEDGE